MGGYGDRSCTKPIKIPQLRTYNPINIYSYLTILLLVAETLTIAHSAEHSWDFSAFVKGIPNQLLENGNGRQSQKSDIDEYSSDNCDRIFVSTPENKSGIFRSPYFENPFNYSRQCIYTFVAAKNERVKIKFTNFHLRGIPSRGHSVTKTPACEKEYLDIYSEIKDSSMDLIDTPFGGRYCGDIPPRFRISMHPTLVFGLHTIYPEVHDAFEGTYGFFKEDRYMIGTPVPDTKCSFTIRMDHEDRRSGRILTPTYPGVYPKGLNCSYTFLGLQNQRILIELLDFDLFFGGFHCPFDYVKFYDGTSNRDPEIGTYCGQHRKLRIYSSNSSLLMVFVSLHRTVDGQNRGFNGTYYFSESLVKLSFIQSDGEHIRGTECDQKILSKKESNGTIFSPNYPFPYHKNVLCRYYIYGLEDSQNLERVHIQMDIFSIGTRENGTCNNGLLNVYLNNHDIMSPIDEENYVFCGDIFPRIIIADGPRLVLIFSSQNSSGRGFKGRYWFETYYEIPGIPATDGSCSFIYNSDVAKSGTFNSPRHPKNYPLNLECKYNLIGNPDEHIELTFNTFETSMDQIREIYGYMENCQQDYVDIFEVLSSGLKHIGRYCGGTTPGPFITETNVHKLLVVLQSDGSGVAGGFRATYKFLSTREVAKRKICGENVNVKESSGLITSPNYPEKYYSAPFFCEWTIIVPQNTTIILVFSQVEIEGEPKARGCSPAAVRVWNDTNGYPLEFCGQASALNDVTLSSTKQIRISFTTSLKAVGGNGFKAVWTKLYDGPDCESMFRCQYKNYCIDANLQCNDEMNCGKHDDTDEAQCAAKSNLDATLIIIASLGIPLIFIICMCIWCRRKSKRKRAQEKERENRQKRFCDATGMRISTVDTI